MSRPNIIYLVCHDLGRHLPVYGVPTDAPHLSQLASEGGVFTRAFCSSPACSPSRMCEMTGKYAHHSGGIGLAYMGWALSPEQRTIVGYLNEAGYETAHFGMNHERRPGTNRDQIDEEESSNHGQADLAVDGAIKCLMKVRDSSRPFYMNIGTVKCHASRWQRSIDLYGGLTPDDQVAVPLPAADLPLLRRTHGYLQSAIRFLDSQVGRLLAAINEAGLRDSTLFVFTTDHGIRHHRGKGSLYDDGVGISLIVRPPAGVVSAPTQGAPASTTCLATSISFPACLRQQARRRLMT